MSRFSRRHYKWLRHIPRQRHLKGSWLHRRLGDQLFAPVLWKFSRHGVASGLAVGLFIGCTPTIGIQLVLAGIAAYFLKINIPMAMVGALITNPFTAPIVYPLQYKLGVTMVGVPPLSEIEGYGGTLLNYARHAKPLWVGSLAAGTVCAVVSYALVMFLWKEARILGDVIREKRSHLHHPQDEIIATELVAGGAVPSRPCALLSPTPQAEPLEDQGKSIFPTKQTAPLLPAP